jgi:CheY-like chemotaxis protein
MFQSESEMNPVLVVDDDESYRELLVLTLEDQCGVPRVESFPGAAPLLRHLAGDAEPPALVLLDLHMPGMNGLDLMAEVRSIAPRVPIAFLSGAAGPEERAACIAAGAAAFVRKPAAYADLIDVLQDLVRSHAAGPQ